MTGIDMVTCKPDDEGVQCGQCGGPIVRPYPCHQGCESQVGGGERVEWEEITVPITVAKQEPDRPRGRYRYYGPGRRPRKVFLELGPGVAAFRREFLAQLSGRG